jgi:hypothetical protein
MGRWHFDRLVELSQAQATKPAAPRPTAQAAPSTDLLLLLAARDEVDQAVDAGLALPVAQLVAAALPHLDPAQVAEAAYTVRFLGITDPAGKVYAALHAGDVERARELWNEIDPVPDAAPVAPGAVGEDDGAREVDS